MPLTRYQLRSDYGLADPEVYGTADRDDPEALLEGVAMAGLVGVLRQLGDLAEFSAEIFHDLHEEVMATAARGHGLMVRVQQLEAEFPSIEKAFLSKTTHSLFFTNAGVDWHPNLRTDQNLITRGEFPRFVMDSYEECRGPPRLFLLDKFDVAGAGACFKRYTDPSFFKMGAATSGTPKVEVQREKKVGKIKKKGSRWKNGETPEVVPASHAKLHQLFLEESIENGYTDPARLVKMKKGKNGSLLDSKSGKSYMEKFLEPPSPEHKVVYETSYSPPHLKLTADNASESGHILDISTLSPRKSLQGKESRGSSPNEENIILKQVVDELNEKAIDRGSSNVPGSNPYVGPDITPLTFNEMFGDEVLAADRGSKSEGSVDGYISDDVTSEMDNYVDALATLESEMGTDNEYRPKNDLGFLNIKKRETDSDANDQVESQVQFSDIQSSGNSCASDDGNSLVKEERSSFSYSDTGSDLAETSPFDGDGVAKVFSSVFFTETRVVETVDMPSDQLCINEKIPGTKSCELVVPNGRSIVETKIPELGEVSCRSCLNDTTHMLLPSDPRSSSVIGSELHETFLNCIKLGTALSDTNNNGTYLGDNFQSLFVPSHVPSQTRDDFLDLVSAESHAVVELDNGDPNIFSNALLHWWNVLDLAPEKESDNSVDEVPQPEYAANGYSKSLVDEKIGSPCSIISPAEEQQLGSTLPEGEACSGFTLFAYCSAASAACYLDVVKPECIVAEVDDAIPAARVHSESSTHLVDTPQIHSFSEQEFSVMKNDVTPREHDSATLGLPYSGEKIICEGISRTIDGDEISGFTCYEDVVGGNAAPPELPSDHPNSLGDEDHVNLDKRVTEAIQAEDLAMDGVTSAATDIDVDVHGVICTSPDLNGSQPWNLLNLQESLSGSGDSLQKGLEFNAENSPEFSIESEAREEMSELTVAPTDVDSTRMNSVSFDHSNSEMFAGVHDSSLAKRTQNSLCNATTAPIFSELNNQELKSKSPNQGCLLVNSEDAVSSPASCQLEPGNELYQALELQAGQFELKRLQGDGPSNKSLDVQFERKQLSNHIDQARHPNTSSESCPEELPSKPSSPEFSSQTGGQKFDGTEQATVSLNTLTSGFSLFPEATQVNMEDMPPLPPLPPMQWRVGKVQYALPPTCRELVEHRPDSFSGIQPPIANEKAEDGIPESQEGIMPPQNPFFLLAALTNGKSKDISEHLVGNLVSSSPTSLQIPAMLSDANTLHSCLSLEKTQSLNPFLTLPETSNGRPEHVSHASEGELVQSSLNPFSPAPPVEDKTSMHNPVCSHGKLIQPPNHLAPERCLEAQTHQHRTQNIEGERENPPDTSMPPDTREDEHIQHVLQTSDGEKLCSSNISSLLLIFEVGKPNGNQAIKVPRPRSALIDAVAAHDKSKLRKATERVRPQIVPKVDERDSLLEQIRTKSFNLKPAGVTRPSIRGPNTNLKVAAILEKANAIRQALAGSDEDDDADSWE